MTSRLWRAGVKTIIHIGGLLREFLKYVKSLDFKGTLHMFHEMLVLEKEQQEFGYVVCYEDTGMLKGLK